MALSMNSLKQGTLIPELQIQAATSFISGPVVDLFNGASNETINLNYHNSKKKFILVQTYVSEKWSKKCAINHDDLITSSRCPA